MCGGWSRPAPQQAIAPAPAPAPAPSPSQEVVVSGDQNRKRAIVGAAGRSSTILTGSNNLGQANIGKTLLGA